MRQDLKPSDEGDHTKQDERRQGQGWTVANKDPVGTTSSLLSLVVALISLRLVASAAMVLCVRIRTKINRIEHEDCGRDLTGHFMHASPTPKNTEKRSHITSMDGYTAFEDRD